MNIDTSAVSPSTWEGELTEEKLDMIVRGLLIPSPEMSRRLAQEVVRLRLEKPSVPNNELPPDRCGGDGTYPNVPSKVKKVKP